MWEEGEMGGCTGRKCLPSGGSLIYIIECRDE